MKRDHTESQTPSGRPIDADGNFVQFPGVNVIARVNPNDETFWKSIYDCLNNSSLIKQHFSLLPHQSYHMTTNNLYTQMQRGDEEWQKFIDNNLIFFKELNLLLKDHYTFIPEIQIKSAITRGVLQLIVELPTEQKNKITGIAAQLKLNDLIPSVFHITLAYQYRVTNESINQKIEQLFSQEVMPICEKISSVNLLQPALCYFNAMTAFYPWDGQSSPFPVCNKPSLLTAGCTHFQARGMHDELDECKRSKVLEDEIVTAEMANN